MNQTCLIVDDEPSAHLVLKNHIDRTEALEFKNSVYNGIEALNYLQNHRVDIVFLDIEMPKLNGIELLQSLTEKPAIILTTAYDNFGYEAYQNDVIDYLLKPISYPRFLKAVNKTKKVLENSIKPENQITSLSYKHSGIPKTVNINDICFIESMGNYIKLITINSSRSSQKIVLKKTMKEINNSLPHTDFIRVHKSFIVNKNFISKKAGDYLLLKDNYKVPIGRKYSILLESNL